ncbi:MAG: hypothetical protein ACM3SR_14275 [Ignavibacteriales bacterium]|jgi:hypothetical protein
MIIQRFKHIAAWQKAQELVDKIYKKLNFMWIMIYDIEACLGKRFFKLSA